MRALNADTLRKRSVGKILRKIHSSTTGAMSKWVRTRRMFKSNVEAGADEGSNSERSHEKSRPLIIAKPIVSNIHLILCLVFKLHHHLTAL